MKKRILAAVLLCSTVLLVLPAAASAGMEEEMSVIWGQINESETSSEATIPLEQEDDDEELSIIQHEMAEIWGRISESRTGLEEALPLEQGEDNEDIYVIQREMEEIHLRIRNQTPSDVLTIDAAADYCLWCQNGERQQRIMYHYVGAFCPTHGGGCTSYYAKYYQYYYFCTNPYCTDSYYGPSTFYEYLHY